MSLNSIALLTAAAPSTNGTTSRLRGAGQFFAIVKATLPVNAACKVQHSVDGVNWLDAVPYGATVANITVAGTYFYAVLFTFVRGVSNGTSGALATCRLFANGKGEVGVTEAFTSPVTTPAVSASGTVTFSGVGTAADTITVAGVVYTLRAAATVAGDVTIAGTAALSAVNLAAAINGNTLNVANPSVTATVAGAIVTVRARVPGLVGNSITLAEVGTGTTVSAATLASGAAIVFRDNFGATIERFMSLTAAN